MAQILFIIADSFQDLIWRLKIISGVFSFIFLFLFVFIFIKFRELIRIKIATTKELIRTPEYARVGAVQSQWEEIERHMESNRESDWKLAIIEGDKLIDYLLKNSGYPGDTMGDRLMSIEKGQFVYLDELWFAHKIRNKVVHDANYFLRYGEARKAVNAYQNIAREFNAI